MLIDWFTVVAQIINFLILVFLLWRFLYKPILKTIDNRQRQIDQRWRDAEQKRQEAEQEARDYRQKRQDLEERRQDILAKAQEEAEADRKQRMHQARQEIESLKHQWHEALENEQESFLADLRSRVTHQVYDITRRVLKDLADADLEQQAAQIFLQQLQDLDSSQKTDLRQAVHDSEQDVMIRSSFELPQDTRQQLVDTVKSQLDLNGNSVQVDVNQDLIFGVELQAGGQFLAWNVKDYLQQLEEQLSAAIRREEQQIQTTAPASEASASERQANAEPSSTEDQTAQTSGNQPSETESADQEEVPSP